MTIIVQKHKHCHRANDKIPKDTVSVRNLSEQEEAQNSGEDDLRIIIHGYFSCRSMTVCSRYGKLPACCT